ncbi:MAG TPA: IS1634 family transposase, partial [Thermoanaerobaculia bacterium]|nr:IS1634 family transposase [Thermoanaerobaculia bacterium]
VAPAQRSPSALRKARTLKTADGLPAHSFATLLKELATLTKNRIQPKTLAAPAFDTLARPTRLQQKALSLLAVPV